MVEQTDIAGLIERLNRRGVCVKNQACVCGGDLPRIRESCGYWAISQPVNPDGPEAATALAELSAKLKLAELALQRAADESATATARIAEMEAALRAIRDGDVPRPVASYWRNDCKPSKHDQCEHRLSMWQHCGQCTDVFIDQALGRAS